MALQLIYKPVYIIMDSIYPAALAYNISRGHYLPGEVGEGATCKFSTPILSGSLFTPQPYRAILTEVTI